MGKGARNEQKGAVVEKRSVCEFGRDKLFVNVDRDDVQRLRSGGYCYR